MNNSYPQYRRHGPRCGCDLCQKIKLYQLGKQHPGLSPQAVRTIAIGILMVLAAACMFLFLVRG